MKKYTETLMFIFWIFTMFVPYGYLAWYWAVPISIISFIKVVGTMVKLSKDTP